MTSYNWVCGVCESVNPSGTSVCATCNSSSVLSAFDIERLRQNVSASDQTQIPLPVTTTFLNAFLTLRDGRKPMFFALIGTALAGALLETVVGHNALGKAPWFVVTLVVMASFALSVLFAITCHRMVLLGKSAVPKFGVYHWSMRETRFFGWSCLLTVVILAIVVGLALMFLFASFFSYVNWLILGVYLAVLPAVYVAARLALLLPATAVDERHGLVWAWELSRGNGWRLVTTLALAPIIFGAVSLILPHDQNIVTTFLWSLIGSVVGAMEITTLSLSFRFLSKRPSTV